jgi:hypothetical protein
MVMHGNLLIQSFFFNLQNFNQEEKSETFDVC